MKAFASLKPAVFFIVIIPLIFSCTKIRKEYAEFFSSYDEYYLGCLLELSKKAIISQFENKAQKKFEDITYSCDDRGVFVRLLKNGMEKGCIGFLQGAGDMEDAVKKATLNAAFYDKRFVPLSMEELDTVEIEITIIGRLEHMKDPYDFIIGIDSLYMENYSNKGFLQAGIAVEKKQSKKEFLDALCKKAGMKKGAYNDRRIRIYKAVTVSLRKKFDGI